MCIINCYENADESTDGMLGCMWITMVNSQLDWEEVSYSNAYNANCDFRIKQYTNINLHINIFRLNDSVIKANYNALILYNPAKIAIQNLTVDV